MNSLSQSTQRNKTRRLVYMAILLALSFVGAQVNVMGSIALDSLPAFFAGLLFWPTSGAIVGGVGHLLTAMTSGFPMTVPIHILLMLTMAFVCWLYGYLNNRINITLNSIIAILLNGVVATYLSVMLMEYLGIIPNGKELFFILLGPLMLASTFNVVVAAILYKLLKDKIIKE
ncbi:MAG: ECF transporter S component [Tissierella sp.]|nr:ECF transporter S component [Tissierella sp.]